MEKKNVYAGTGISRDDDPYKAGKEAVEMAIEKAGKSPEFGVVFCSGGKYGNNDKRIKKLVEGAHDAFMAANKNCKWIGCTTAGEISNYGFSTDSCVAMIINSQYIHFGVGVGKNINLRPKEAGQRAIKDALKNIKTDKYIEPYVRYLAEKKLPNSELIQMRPYSVMMLNTGFTAKKRGNEDDIIEGIVNIIGYRIPIIGGSSGDDFNLKKTYSFLNGLVYEDSVICTIISSSIKIGSYVSHEYLPTEKSVFINKAQDYTVYEMDKKNAFDRYSEVIGKTKENIWPKTMKLQKLGSISTAFMSFAKKLGIDVMKLSPVIGLNCNSPLALVEYKPYVKGRFWIKAIDSVIDNKYLRFTEKVPQENVLYLMKTNKEKSLNAGPESVIGSLKQVDNEASFSLIFDCALHRWFIGKHAAKSVELIKKNLKNIPFVGFFGYGEILDGKHTLSVVSMVAGKKLISD